jgi:ketosteroid isomerase-like protein
MTTTSAPTLEDARIRERLDSLARALRGKQIDALMAHYAPDMVVFDIAPPLQRQGADAYRRNFEAWFAAVSGPIGYEVSDLRITATDDVALSHHLGRVRTVRTGGESSGYWADYSVRVTAAWRKINGRWLITHEHVSVPLDMATLRAA